MPEEKADLVYDSARLESILRGTLGEEDERTLLFKCGQLCVDLKIRSDKRRGTVIVGQVIQDSSGRPLKDVKARLEGEEIKSDVHGQFAVASDDLQPAQLRLRTAHGELLCRIPCDP